MSGGVLERILAVRREDLAVRKRERPASALRAELPPPGTSFRAALGAPGCRFILEVKRASPSRGAIRPDLDLEGLLRLYDRHADAISVLTEPRFFGGSDDDLRAARRLTRRPVLRKDFIFDPYQLVESRWLGASAVLLIVAALEQGLLVELAAAARELGLEPLIEVHDEAELERALAAGAEVIGINNRDLRTLRIDLGVTERLAGRIPDDRLVVTESGVLCRGDVLRLAPVADAFLIGSAIMAAPDPEAAVKELIYGRVKICGITSREDAEAARHAGATWIGFVFHPDSPRFVFPARAAEIARDLGCGAVGVFVRTPVEEIRCIAQEVGLAGVQLHGEQPESVIAALREGLDGVFLVKVVRVREHAAELPATAADYYLLDTWAPDRHGGTGRRFPVEVLRALRAADAQRFAERIIVAGGLNPGNIVEVAREGPFGMDLSSGVELAPGRKDHEALARLFAGLRALEKQGREHA